MKDYAADSFDRNYGIRRETDRRNLCELLLIGASLAMIAAVLFSYSWVRAELVATGYALQQLQSEERELLREQQKLTLEEERLKHPGRIDDIARNGLGLSRMRAAQILPASMQDVRRDAADSLALAGNASAGSNSRKPSAVN